MLLRIILFVLAFMVVAWMIGGLLRDRTRR